MAFVFSFGCFSQTAVDFYNIGNDKLDLKDFKGALEEFNKAIELNPNKAEFFMNRAIAKSEIGEYRSAIEEAAAEVNDDVMTKYLEGEELTAGDFVIDMKSLKVDPASVTEKDKKSADLEAHLKNADFFDVEKNPTAAFKITNVAALDPAATGAIEGANKTVSGNLTLKGKSLNVSFPAKVTVANGTASIQAKFTVNRADWDIKFGTSEADPAEWMISKDIEIGINVNAAK